MDNDQVHSRDAPRRRPRRSHDKLLWILVALVLLAIVARLVAKDYALNHQAYDCFPGCSFEQHLANNVSGGAPIVAVFLTGGLVVRWVRLGRKASPQA